MKVEKLWKVLSFADHKKIKRKDIEPENWFDFNDFLTNGSDGVFVAHVTEGGGDIPAGSIVVVDQYLEATSGDMVIELINDEMAIKRHAPDLTVFGVITCVVKPLPSHRRQRNG